ncbi:MAG TPA: DJ-1/PfpI family protein [Thermoanaerobaculia bacterium]|nr:DJ-1/PfpI family protein [Thermoanaerobaculia bacterium]
MTLRIAIPIYENCDLIDVAAPFDILSRITDFWYDDEVDLRIVAETASPVMTGQKVAITPHAAFDNFPQVDVLLVPGAYDVSNGKKKPFQDFIKAQSAQAQWVTSVCTGAIVLAEAGLLDGYQATTHWAGLQTLRGYEKVKVVNGCPRWVHDRNRVTGGGVSSSLDAAIYLVSLLTNEHVAKCAQLIVQYNPHPPFAGGDPCVADYDTYIAVAGD